jgi:hypothetical protein
MGTDAGPQLRLLLERHLDRRQRRERRAATTDRISVPIRAIRACLQWLPDCVMPIADSDTLGTKLAFLRGDGGDAGEMMEIGVGHR